MMCKIDEHDWEQVACFPFHEEPILNVVYEHCSKCGILHLNLYSRDGLFVRPYKSYVPSQDSSVMRLTQ